MRIKATTAVHAGILCAKISGKILFFAGLFLAFT
jgi:hypothetical protein